MVTVIRGATVVTQNANRDVLVGDVAVEGGRIAYVGPSYDGTGDEEIDAKGDVLMPGMVNTHTHVAMSVMKGVVDDLRFDEFLDRVFVIDSDRTDADMELGATLGCMEMIRGGTTTFVDLYYSQDVIARAVEAAGLRAVLCWCCLDEEFTTQKGNPVDNCRRFCASLSGSNRITPAVGLQGVYVCNEETCVSARELSDNLGVPLNLHLSETRGEVNEHKRKTGMRPAEWLAHIGALSERCIAAHAAWLTPREVSLMGEAGMSVSTCPVSNMKLATGGIAPVPEFLERGVNVSVGTDGSTTNNTLDMFAEMKTLALLQKSSRWDPTVVTAQQLLDFATLGGAKAIGMADEIGSIEAGKRADLIVLDGKAPNLRPLVPENVVSNIAYSASSLNVRLTMCDGRVLYRDGMYSTINAEDTLSRSEGAWSYLCRR
ncbi:MAG: amidohydrolase family protein [Thermoplasmatales archaeon]|nr:amidohydrolase family protein [Thermoplasmatales archaeon]